MQYFRNVDGRVFAFDQGLDLEAIENIRPGLVAMTQVEIQAHLNPPPAPEPVPQTISRAQGRLVLYRAGLWAQVQDYVAGITDPAEQFEADTALNHTTDWQRSSPFLGRAAQALGLNGQQLDDLFREAAQIVP